MMEIKMTCRIQGIDGKERELTGTFTIEKHEDPVHQVSAYIRDNKHPDEEVLETDWETNDE